jgi:Acetyl-CoA hydrolase/transferase C-terminal domain
MPRFDGPVTTPRIDTHYIVTEVGAANLKRLSSIEQTHALIGEPIRSSVMRWLRLPGSPILFEGGPRHPGSLSNERSRLRKRNMMMNRRAFSASLAAGAAASLISTRGIAAEHNVCASTVLRGGHSLAKRRLHGNKI